MWKPVLTDSAAIHAQVLAANADPNCAGVITWMHTFSPAKMWIAGMDALRKPMLHLHTQAGAALPWSTIDMDFMNLNQAAHGDREFGYIGARLGVARKVVAGHVGNPVVIERVAAWARAARGAHELRTMRLARFGDNMREVAVTEGDKVEAQLRFGVSVNTYGVNELVERVDAAGGAAIDDLVAEYLDAYDVAAELRPGGERHDSLRYGAAIEIGLREFLTDGGFTAFTTNFEDLAGLRQLPGLAVQRLMADGYGFGGEGDWKTSVILRTTKAMATGRSRRHLVHGGLHLRPGHARLGEDPRRPHARGVPEHRRHPADSGDPPAGHRWARGPGPAALHGSTRTRGRGRHQRHGRPLPAHPQRGHCRRTRRTPAEAPGRLRRLGAEAGVRHLRRGAGSSPAARTTPCCRRPWATPEFRDLATMLSTELVVIDGSTPFRPVRERAAVERGLPPPCRTLVAPRCPTTRWRWWTKIASVTGPKPRPRAAMAGGRGSVPRRRGGHRDAAPYRPPSGLHPLPGAVTQNVFGRALW